MPRKPSKAAVDFFYRHAGYGAPAGASKAGLEKAQRAAAEALARAEEEAEKHGWEVTWEDDPEGWDSLGEIPEEEVHEVLWAALRDEDGTVLASLGSIVNPDRSYGRVVEAELALEALSEQHQSNPRRRRPLHGAPVPGRIYSIGMGGLSELGGEQVNIEPKGTYYLGASSSPKQIVVKRVTPEMIYYETYPWGGKAIQIQRSIGADLIEQGSRTWLEGPQAQRADMASWIAKRKAGLESALAGGPPEKVNVEDYRPVRVLVKATRKKSEYPRGDPWYGAEEYGNVGGIEEGGETLYDIETSKGEVRKLKRDKRFKVVTVEDRPERDY